jgi:hypothetical protein
MSKRSKSLADELKAKEAAENAEKQEREHAEQTRNAKILRDDELLKRESDNLWTKFSEEIQSQCNEFNEETSAPRKLAVNRVVLNRITVSYVDAGNVTREMRVSFDSKSHTISVSGLYLPSTPPLIIKVLPGDSDPTIVDERDHPIDVELTIDFHLRHLLGLQ